MTLEIFFRVFGQSNHLLNLVLVNFFFFIPPLIIRIRPFICCGPWRAPARGARVDEDSTTYVPWCAIQSRTTDRFAYRLKIQLNLSKCIWYSCITCESASKSPAQRLLYGKLCIPMVMRASSVRLVPNCERLV